MVYCTCFVHRDNPWKPVFVIRTVPCNATYLPTYLPDRCLTQTGLGFDSDLNIGTLGSLQDWGCRLFQRGVSYIQYITTTD
jgi:hypothetical protein